MTKPELRIVHYDAAGTMRLREPLKALYLKTHLDQQHSPFYSPEQFWERLETALLTFLWVVFHDRPGSGGQSPPRVRSAMAIRESGLW